MENTAILQRLGMKNGHKNNPDYQKRVHNFNLAATLTSEGVQTLKATDETLGHSQSHDNFASAVENEKLEQYENPMKLFNMSGVMQSVKLSNDRLVSSNNVLKVPIEYDIQKFKRQKFDASKLICVVRNFYKQREAMDVLDSASHPWTGNQSAKARRQIQEHFNKYPYQVEKSVDKDLLQVRFMASQMMKEQRNEERANREREKYLQQRMSELAENKAKVAMKKSRKLDEQFIRDRLTNQKQTGSQLHRRMHPVFTREDVGRALNSSHHSSSASFMPNLKKMSVMEPVAEEPSILIDEQRPQINVITRPKSLGSKHGLISKKVTYQSSRLQKLQTSQAIPTMNEQQINLQISRSISQDLGRQELEQQQQQQYVALQPSLKTFSIGNRSNNNNNNNNASLSSQALASSKKKRSKTAAHEGHFRNRNFNADIKCEAPTPSLNIEKGETMLKSGSAQRQNPLVSAISNYEQHILSQESQKSQVPYQRNQETMAEFSDYVQTTDNTSNLKSIYRMDPLQCNKSSSFARSKQSSQSMSTQEMTQDAPLRRRMAQENLKYIISQQIGEQRRKIAKKIREDNAQSMGGTSKVKVVLANSRGYAGDTSIGGRTISVKGNQATLTQKLDHISTSISQIKIRDRQIYSRLEKQFRDQQSPHMQPARNSPSKKSLSKKKQQFIYRQQSTQYLQRQDIPTDQQSLSVSFSEQQIPMLSGVAMVSKFNQQSQPHETKQQMSHPVLQAKYPLPPSGKSKNFDNKNNRLKSQNSSTHVQKQQLSKKKIKKIVNHIRMHGKQMSKTIIPPPKTFIEADDDTQQNPMQSTLRMDNKMTFDMGTQASEQKDTDHLLEMTPNDFMLMQGLFDNKKGDEKYVVRQHEFGGNHLYQQNNFENVSDDLDDSSPFIREKKITHKDHISVVDIN